MAGSDAFNGGVDIDSLQSSISAGETVVADTGNRFEQVLLDGRHVIRADEPVSAGGHDLGPGPYELLTMALGACTSVTLRMYADRKQWPLKHVIVRLRHQKVHATDCAGCESTDSLVDRIHREIKLIGPLNDDQRERLLKIASMCPVHRTLSSKIDIRTELDREML